MLGESIPIPFPKSSEMAARCKPLSSNTQEELSLVRWLQEKWSHQGQLLRHLWETFGCKSVLKPGQQR